VSYLQVTNFWTPEKLWYAALHETAAIHCRQCGAATSRRIRTAQGRPLLSGAHREVKGRAGARLSSVCSIVKGIAKQSISPMVGLTLVLLIPRIQTGEHS
jgi:hypothetical protein